MNAELYIHGPRHAIYGKRDEDAYFQGFDNSKIKDDIRFTVEIRKNENKLYTYYNYLRYSNVTDIAGRTGAYIGITLRLDAYYANLNVVYTVLHSIFSKSVVGTLVSQTSTGGFQYKVDNFEHSKAEILDKIEKPFGTILANIISLQEIYQLDANFINPNILNQGKYIVKGIDDTKDFRKRLAEIKSIGRIVFSSHQPIEQLQVVIDQCEREKQKFAESKQGEITNLEKTILATKSELHNSQTLVSQLNNEVEKLSKELSSLKHEIQAFEEEKNNLDKIKAEKKELEKQNKQLHSELEDIQKKLKSHEQSEKSLNGKLKTLQTDKDDLKKQVKELEKQIESLNNKISVLTNNVDGDSASEEGCYRETSIWKKWMGYVVAFFCGAILFSLLGLYIGKTVLNKPNQTDDNNVPTEAIKKVKVTHFPNELTERIFPDKKQDEILVISEKEFYVGEKYTISCISPLDNCYWEISNASIVDSTQTEIKVQTINEGRAIIRLWMSDTIVAQRVMNFKIK